MRVFELYKSGPKSNINNESTSATSVFKFPRQFFLKHCTREKDLFHSWFGP